jgi:polygalacturonase
MHGKFTNTSLKISFFLLLALPCQAIFAQGTGRVISSPIPTFAQKSPEVGVSANNESVPVEHFRDSNVARLSTDDTVTLKITTGAPITSYSIHPDHFRLKGNVQGNTLTVSVSATQFEPQPTYLIVKINDMDNLVILVDPLEKNAPTSTTRGVIDVQSAPFSADPSGKNLATTAIQSAIDKASSNGGGVVFVGPGFYRIQSLMLKDNVTLYLSEGAVIQGSAYSADFRDDPTYTSKQNFPYMIQAQDFKNIAVKGRGVLDCAGGTVYGDDGAPQTVAPGATLRRGAIRVTNGNGFTLEGVTIRDSSTWTVVMDRVENVSMSRPKLIGPIWPRNDGIDIFGRHVRVEKAFVYTGDDNFCVKALKADYPANDITFKDSIGYGNSAGVKVGNESASTQSDIHFEDIDIVHTGRGLVVERKGNSHNTGAIQNVYFTDIRVEKVEGTGGISRNPIHINDEGPGTISNIFFKRVSLGNFGPHSSVISGFDSGDSVSNVSFEDLIIGGKPIDSAGAGDFQIKDAGNIKFTLSQRN